MPLIFQNGGAPLYEGVLKETVTDVLQFIKDTLLTAGWTLHLGDFNALPMVLASGKTVSSQKAYMRFTSPAAGTIRLNGDLFGDGVTLSINTTDFASIGTGTRVWITADDETAAVYVKPASLIVPAIEFGWLDQIPNPNDSFAWGVWGLNNFVTAVTATNRNKMIARFYDTTTAWNSAPFNGVNNVSHYTFLVNFGNGANNSTNIPSNGGKPIIVRIPIQDGVLALSNYSFRGYLKFARNGLMGGAPASNLRVDGDDINNLRRYVMCGDTNHGFRIA